MGPNTLAAASLYKSGVETMKRSSAFRDLEIFRPHFVSSCAVLSPHRAMYVLFDCESLF
jgi:hypothetical protein